ncbi:nuclear transport factor 2 family protein [Glutamicibacter soli]|uniref:DUF4440 domain-containing protein n=1 Tax=Glutamicibacter soli TaxID=453836 RepID=A0A6L9FZB9_9MICC|nr:nuclear transport factor 2 family protein [Glutamicibacter soli]NAZ14922.1 DUF4440 domain-containing protein [Glutamicibacter soli]
MWESDISKYREVYEAELALLSSEVRNDSQLTESYLAPDFAEIGRSGRRWVRKDLVAALQSEPAGILPQTSEWLFNPVGPGLVLVTYRIQNHATASRHSSLWELQGPVLRYHQGTPVVKD